MDFGIFAVAFNIGKLFNNQGIKAIDALKSLLLAQKYAVFVFLSHKTMVFQFDNVFSTHNFKLVA
jgi:hypothetical protein